MKTSEPNFFQIFQKIFSYNNRKKNFVRLKFENSGKNLDEEKNLL